jgi:hypothetical protein
MEEQNQSLAELQHIKKIMERSGRFISLSGLSGIAAGVCALTGAWFAHVKIQSFGNGDSTLYASSEIGTIELLNDLLWIATLTFIAAFVSAFVFTYIRSKKNKVTLFGPATMRLFWNTAFPLAVGGVFIIRLLQMGDIGLVAPSCLIFYGLALVNASKYTLGEIRYLGYGQIALGIMNLWYIGYGLQFWAMGFGVMHIIYGISMWWKYERNTVAIEGE